MICDWVREFYYNMHDDDENGFSTYVRGKHIVINPKILAPDSENIPNEPDVVSSILCSGERTWAGDSIL